MTDPDLDRIEEALNLKLPLFYRKYMLSYPSWLAERQPQGSDVAQWEFANDPEQIIRFNRYVRAAEPSEFFDDAPWPPHYFVIGSRIARRISRFPSAMVGRR